MSSFPCGFSLGLHTMFVERLSHLLYNPGDSQSRSPFHTRESCSSETLSTRSKSAQPGSAAREKLGVGIWVQLSLHSQWTTPLQKVAERCLLLPQSSNTRSAFSAPCVFSAPVLTSQCPTFWWRCPFPSPAQNASLLLTHNPWLGC